MLTSDYILQFLADKGIKHVFLVYGSAIGELVDSFSRVKGIKHVCPQHEQGAGFMAEGWAKVAGLPGVAMATSGPGGTNLLTAIANCWYDSVPSIFITGNVRSEFLRTPEQMESMRQAQSGFQENDIVSMARPITKAAYQFRKDSNVRYGMERLWHEATTGRPGPVLLDVPMDVQAQSIKPEELEGFKTFTWEGVNMPGMLRNNEDTDLDLNRKINRFITDLASAKKPAVLVGGGCWKDRGQVRRLIHRLGIPAFPTWNALDIITSDDPCYGGRIGTYGGAGRNIAIQQCDLLLILGSRVSGRITGSNHKSFVPEAKTYCVDVDPSLLERDNQLRPWDVNICSDVGRFVAMCLDSTADYPLAKTYSQVKWMEEVGSYRDGYDPVTPAMFNECKPGFVHPYVFCRLLSEAADKDAIIVGDCGGNIVCMNHAFKTKQGQRYFTNNGNSPMGFSMCGAIGAAFAEPKQQVICIIGDGGMQMNIQELQTIKHYELPIKVFVLNNGCYGITRQYQRTNFEGRSLACGPDGYSAPDFVRVAQAYGLRANMIECMSGIPGIQYAIKYALAQQEPMILDVACKDHTTYEPRVVGWGTPIHQMEPKL